MRVLAKHSAGLRQVYLYFAYKSVPIRREVFGGSAIVRMNSCLMGRERSGTVTNDE